MADFDVAALYEALDRERASRGLTWQQVAREINSLFEQTAARPISASTVTGTRRGGIVEGDGVFQMLRWLGRAPESFAPDGASAMSGRELPVLGKDVILRFDVQAIYAALDAGRSERGLTWAEVAREIGGVNASSLSRLQAGARVSFPSVMRIFRWLGQPAVSFTRASKH